MREYEKLVQEEYKKLKEVFEGTDDKQLELLEGTFWETARLRVELNQLYAVVKQTGLLLVKDGKPSMQKELPVSKLIVKVRANYLNYISKLSSILGRSVDEDDESLTDYE